MNGLNLKQTNPMNAKNLKGKRKRMFQKLLENKADD